MIAVVGSPPYADGATSIPAAGSKMFREWRKMQGRSNDKPGYQGLVDSYGQTPGQLAALPLGAPATETRSDMVEITDWTGCYDNGWKGLISDAAFSHPAKFAHGLIRRIYQHLLAEGMVQPGDVVIDPFGGVALGGLYAMQNGLHWIGCELEARFVELGNENIALWNSRFAAHFPRWGSARLLQGDSRRLAEVVSGAGCVVGSPPYWDAHITNIATGRIGDNTESPWKQTNGDNYGATPGQLGQMPPGQPPAGLVSSPPFAGNTGGRGEASRNGIDAALFDRHGGGMKGGTGADPANLDNLPMGTISAVVSSPPYADGCAHTGGNDPKPDKIQGGKRGAYGVAVVTSPPFAGSVGSDDPAKRGGLLVSDPKRAGDVNLTGSYGTSSGQLGGMATGDVAAVVGSPPFENSIGTKDEDFWAKHNDATQNWNGATRQTADYGDDPANIGNDSGETFWSAAKLIIDQCYQILPPGAPAVWVLKAYVKNGQIVDFPGQWQALCEACGFETVHIHRAWLVKRNGAQATMDGGAVSKDIQKKSFFRRLAEKNGAPPIDFETVLCTRKRAS